MESKRLENCSVFERKWTNFSPGSTSTPKTSIEQVKKEFDIRTREEVGESRLLE
jgi:hypothetical protein